MPQSRTTSPLIIHAHSHSSSSICQPVVLFLALNPHHFPPPSIFLCFSISVFLSVSLTLSLSPSLSLSLPYYFLPMSLYRSSCWFVSRFVLLFLFFCRCSLSSYVSLPLKPLCTSSHCFGYCQKSFGYEWYLQSRWKVAWGDGLHLSPFPVHLDGENISFQFWCKVEIENACVHWAMGWWISNSSVFFCLHNVQFLFAFEWADESWQFQKEKPQSKCTTENKNGNPK